jgi:hypothetical protein
MCLALADTGMKLTAQYVKNFLTRLGNISYCRVLVPVTPVTVFEGISYTRMLWGEEGRQANTVTM